VRPGILRIIEDRDRDREIG